jgi:hypothetical protein
MQTPVLWFDDREVEARGQGDRRAVITTGRSVGNYEATLVAVSRRSKLRLDE